MHGRGFHGRQWKRARMEREVADWNMRSSRRAVSHGATARLADGQSIRVLVTDLSYEGCQILAETEFSVGDTIVLVLQNRGSSEAQVRWTDGDRAGVQFLLGKSTLEQRRARIGV
jgi:hypothetical protein